jgi:MFS family permease
MLLSILALRIYELTKSNAAVSALYIAYGVPAVIFGMLAGALVDHIDKRKVLAFCNISRTILIIPLFFFHETLAVAYAVMFLNSLVSQYYLPAEAPLIPRLVTEKLLLSANSLFSFTFFASIALGFVLAGPVLKYTGAYGSFVILLTLYLTAVWSVFHVPKQKEDVIGLMKLFKTSGFAIVKQLLQDTKKGLDFCYQHKQIYDALTLLAGTQIVLAMLGALGPGFADRVLNIQVTDASLVILGPAVVGIVLGSLWVGNYGGKYSMKKLTTLGLLAAGVILMLVATLVRIERIPYMELFLAGGMSMVLTIILFFLLGVANSFLDVPSNATLQRESTEEVRGRIYGIVTALGGGIGIIPVVAGGILADTLGVGKVMLGLGIVILGYGVIRLRSL